MVGSGVLLLLVMGPVAAYLAGVVVFNGVRLAISKLSQPNPYSRRALPSG